VLHGSWWLRRTTPPVYCTSLSTSSRSTSALRGGGGGDSSREPELCTRSLLADTEVLLERVQAAHAARGRPTRVAVIGGGFAGAYTRWCARPFKQA
jgi:hypothetical protein